MRQWEWRSVWGSGWTCARHTNVVVVQLLMLEACIALFARRHPARWSDTILWMTCWLSLTFQQLAFPSSRNLQYRLISFRRERPDGLSLVPWQNGKALCWDVTVICPLPDSYIFSCCCWCRGGSRTRCFPRSEIRGFRWSWCSHCLRELGSTKRFNSPAPFIPWAKIDWHLVRKPRNQLPVSEMLSLGTAL